MVKGVVGDETQLTVAEERLFKSGLSAEVGLVLGKLSSSLDRGFIFDLVPTPPNDANQPPCSLPLSLDTKTNKKKSSSSSSSSSATSQSLSIDSDWVSEHARQVSRLLLGGMHVVGIYVWATEASFKASTLTLWQTLKWVTEAAPAFDGDLDEGLLVHISYSPRRLTCRSCILSSTFTSSSLRPCDFKTGRVLSSLQAFRCSYNFQIRLPVCSDLAPKGNTLRDVLHDGISCHAKELRVAKAIVDGNLVVEDLPCSSDGLHEVELLVPFVKDSPSEACSQKDVVAVVVFSGSITSFAYLNPKETVLQAIADIKEDILMSLRSRLNIICDEGEEETSSAIDGGREASIEGSTEKSIAQLGLHVLRKPCTLPFPRRVLVPWLADTFICDYLQPSDTFEIVKDRCKELMSIELPIGTAKLLEPESEATTASAESFWDAVSRYSTLGSVTPSATHNEKDLMQKQGDKEYVKSTAFSTGTAIAILLLAVVISLVLIVLDQKS